MPVGLEPWPLLVQLLNSGPDTVNLTTWEGFAGLHPASGS